MDLAQSVAAHERSGQYGVPLGQDYVFQEQSGILGLHEQLVFIKINLYFRRP